MLLPPLAAQVKRRRCLFLRRHAAAKPVMMMPDALRRVFPRIILRLDSHCAYNNLQRGEAAPTAAASGRVRIPSIIKERQVKLQIQQLTILFIAALMAVSAGVALAQQPEQQPADKPAAAEKAQDEKPGINWMTDIEKATALAAENKKPLLLYFTAAWCGPCRTMKSSVFPDAKVVAAFENFNAVMIDEADNRELLLKHKIEGFPTFVILDVNGREVARATGGLPADRLVEFLDYAQAVIALESNPDDVEAIYRRGRLGVLYAPTIVQKREQVEAAMKAVGEDDKEKRARLLIARAMLVESKEKGQVPDEVYGYLREAAALDPDNAFGVREEVDFMIMALDAGRTKDEAALKKSIADYFQKYPPHELRDRNIAMQLLEAQFQLQIKAGEYEAAIKTLETTKPLVDDEKKKQHIDGVIESVRKEMEKKSAPSSTPSPPPTPPPPTTPTEPTEPTPPQE